MSQTVHHFQLPTGSAAATERLLLRRQPGAEQGTPTREVAEAPSVDLAPCLLRD